ncbi:hypothetical protein B0O99DRAFT_633673 [Bisporella sp. PMI_857]|nr:hypothetical protein B0O99DRAFT_633673 [Bisporella sp. PMI_857]
MGIRTYMKERKVSGMEDNHLVINLPQRKKLEKQFAEFQAMQPKPSYEPSHRPYTRSPSPVSYKAPRRRGRAPSVSSVESVETIDNRPTPIQGSTNATTASATNNENGNGGGWNPLVVLGGTAVALWLGPTALAYTAVTAVGLGVASVVGEVAKENNRNKTMDSMHSRAIEYQYAERTQQQYLDYPRGGNSSRAIEY